MCFDYDGERAEVWREATRKARKPHRCSECSGPIAVGDRYFNIFSVYEGNADTYRCCPKCQLVREEIHRQETDRGCAEYESWPHIGGLSEYAPHYDIEWPPRLVDGKVAMASGSVEE